MTTDNQRRDEKLSMILIEKLQKHQPYHQLKLLTKISYR